MRTQRFLVSGAVISDTHLNDSHSTTCDQSQGRQNLGTNFYILYNTDEDLRSPETFSSGEIPVSRTPLHPNSGS